MASCFVCHKKAQKGYMRSHSNIKTKRLFKPNLHVLKVKFLDQVEKQVTLCSKCYKKIQNEFWEGKRQHFVPVSLLNQKANLAKKALTTKKSAELPVSAPVETPTA